MPTTVDISAPVVAAENLVKSYGATRAVDGVSFAVGRGECFGLLGPNGAGKTTTIRLAYGFFPLTSGRLRVFGMDIAAEPRRIKARIGVCQQADSLDPDLTVMENLLVFAGYFDIRRRSAEAKGRDLLRFMELEDRAGAPIHALSGGMRRRLMLARALVNDPDLLILDEPTIGLDPQSRHQVWGRLRELQGRGLSILLTTHYMDEAARLCGRLVIMDRGRILVEGKPADLVRSHAGKNVIEIAEPDPELRAFVADMGMPVDDLGHRLIVYCGDREDAYYDIAGRCRGDACGLRQATLEDVFLRLTGRDLRE